MPRLPNSLLRQAYGINPIYAKLLPECRSLEDARNEFRWLKQHAISQTKSKSKDRAASQVGWQTRLRQLCHQRARGVPLQYLLGTEHFGDIELLCQPGVLIPRPETAAATAFLASRLLANARCLPPDIRILDLCTGTGCIPLLLRHSFAVAATTSHSHRDTVPRPHILGVDISPHAISLARLNRARLDRLEPVLHAAAAAGHVGTLRFERADVLCDSSSSSAPPLSALLAAPDMPGRWDMLVSNPPYISARTFLRTTARSVRLFEPRLALVPPARRMGAEGVAAHGEDQGGAYDGAADAFYPVLLRTAEERGVKVVLVEVADAEQALRVALLVRGAGAWDGVEIWRDGDMAVESEVQGFLQRGDGNGRAVLCWRGAGAKWLGQG